MATPDVQITIGNCTDTGQLSPQSAARFNGNTLALDPKKQETVTLSSLFSGCVGPYNLQDPLWINGQKGDTVKVGPEWEQPYSDVQNPQRAKVLYNKKTHAYVYVSPQVTVIQK